MKPNMVITEVRAEEILRAVIEPIIRARFDAGRRHPLIGRLRSLWAKY